MKRFTVSLDDDVYLRLVSAAERRTPPATLQQMLRLAVEGLLAGLTDTVELNDVTLPT